MKNEADAIHDLTGRQIINGKWSMSSVRPKGIYIVRRKKMIVK